MFTSVFPILSFPKTCFPKNTDVLVELADLLSFTENSFWVVLNKWSAWKFRGGTGNWGEVSERLTSDRPSGYRTSDMRQQNRQTSVIRQVKSVMKS